MIGDGIVKKTKKKRKPPLSFLDNMLYCVLVVLSIALCVSLFFFFISIQNAIAFGDKSVIAYSDKSKIFWFFPLLLFLVISAIAFFSFHHSERTPVFGNKKVKYGEYPWDKDCFPLFDKRRKNVYVKPSKKRFRRKMILVWLTFLLIFTSVFPLGIFKRGDLHDDYSITDYGVFNQKKNTYTKEDFSRLTITIEEHHHNFRSFNAFYSVELTISMKDKNSFSFSFGDFRSEYSNENMLRTMLNIKSFFAAESITVTRRDRLDTLIDDFKFTEIEIKMLRELFDD